MINRFRLGLLCLTGLICLVLAAPGASAKNPDKVKKKTPALEVQPGQSARVVVDVPEADGSVSQMEFVLSSGTETASKNSQGAANAFASGANACTGSVIRTVWNPAGNLAYRWDVVQNYKWDNVAGTATLTGYSASQATANLWSYHHNTYSSWYPNKATARSTSNGYFYRTLGGLYEFASVDLTMTSAGACAGSASTGTWNP